MTEPVYDSGSLALGQVLSIITLWYTAYHGPASMWKLMRREGRKRTNDKKMIFIAALVRKARK